MGAPSVNPDSRDAFAGEDERSSYGSFGEWKLSLLCKGLGVPMRESKEAGRVFRLLSSSWSGRALGPAPAWQTDITDDGTPFEFSVAFDGRAPRVRILTEAQRAQISPGSSWAAGLALNERLAKLPGVNLERFDRVRDLFAPMDPMEHVGVRFALWHAADLDPIRGTSFKVYLNPQVRGPQSAKGLLMEALARLGANGAGAFLRERISSDDNGNGLAYFSLDLSTHRDSRIKVYVAHPGISAAEIEHPLEGTRDYVPGDGARWIRQLLGTDGPFRRRPLLTCFAFTASGGPPSATLHVPIRDYLNHDGDSLERACEFLAPSDAKKLRRAVELFACRPLSVMASLLTYISLRRLRSGLNVTTYIAPEAFSGRGSGKHAV